MFRDIRYVQRSRASAVIKFYSFSQFPFILHLTDAEHAENVFEAIENDTVAVIACPKV